MKLTQGSFAKRALIVGLIAGGSILAASSYATPTGGPEGKSRCEAMHGQRPHASRETHRAERLAALKEKLDIKPAQEAAWNDFANAAKPGMRHESNGRRAMKAEFSKLNTPERLDKMLVMSDMRRAKMVERAGAIKAFYAQLSPEQQKVFDAEAMPKRSHHKHHLFRHHS